MTAIPNFTAPGVYVVEVPSGNAPIVGAGTSTAAFVGWYGFIAAPGAPTAVPKTTGKATWSYLVVAVNADGVASAPSAVATTTTGAAAIDGTNNYNTVTWPVVAGATTYRVYRTSCPVLASATVPVVIGRIADVPQPGNNATTATVNDQTLAAKSDSPLPDSATGVVVPCSNFTDFKTAFGDLNARPNDTGFINLSQAVYGFFLNGGTFCYVQRIAGSAGVWSANDLTNALASLEAYDDISIVAAPGMVNAAAVSSLVTHCVTMQDRIAVLDSPPGATFDEIKLSSAGTSKYSSTYLFTGGDFAALYYPWIAVAGTPNLIPPSGHIAGIYARVDATRGVHKAPANEPIFGALDLETLVTRNQQQQLNPDGVNCIRRLNNSILVWGARTLGGQDSLNPDVRYVNVRRLLNYLRDSIQSGTRWTVFEPNGPDLWAKVIRNLSAFLKQIWAAGGLFGATPQQAFYVKCDAENNPQASRDQGNLIIEVGVSITKPAEFVVFYISQWAPPTVA